MALETLTGIEKIGGFELGRTELAFGPDHYVELSPDNCITFKIQKGPIKDHGVNGCQVDTMIETSQLILKGLDKKFPCDQNKQAIAALEMAIGMMNERKKDREARGVEGTSAP